MNAASAALTLDGAAGESATSHLVDNADGTITDTRTRLIWSKPTLCDGKRVDYATAAKAAAKWGGRLPTVEELFALADRTRFNPAIDTEAFPDTKSAAYWSSTEDASDSSYAWFVYFYGGFASGCRRGSGNAFVRAVRSVPAGQ